MLNLGFRFAFEGNHVGIFIGTINYNCGFIRDGLMILNTNYASYNHVNDLFL